MAGRYLKMGGKRTYRQAVLQQLREEDEFARMMPVQLVPDRPLSAGQKLCLGILQEAYTSLRGYSSDMPDSAGWEAFWRRRYRSMKEAEVWVDDQQTIGEYWFTFHYCCTMLGYDSGDVRFALLFRRQVNPRLQQYIVHLQWSVMSGEEVEYGTAE
jgi:hypothetical protein